MELRAELRLAFGVALIVLVGAGSLYWPALTLDYVWDDSTFFIDNPSLRTGRIEWETLVRPILPATAYIRPLVMWSFMAEYKYFGVSPAISHGINLAVYLCNVTLVMVLAWTHASRLSFSRPAVRTAIAGVLYGLHPGLIESTVWISGRFDLLATFFVLLALVADLHLRSAWIRAAAIALAFGLGLGSKELAIVLPVLLVLQRLALEPSPVGGARQIAALLQTHARTVLLCTAVVAVYLLVRMGVTDRLAPATIISQRLSTFSAHALYVLQTLFFYLEQCLMPFAGASMPLHPAHPGKVFKAAQLIEAAVATAALCALLAALYSRRYWGLMLLGALVCLAPTLNIVVLPMANSIGCDRFLTLPLVFIALALVSAKFHVQWMRPQLLNAMLALSLGVWGVAAAATVRATIPLWKDNLTLWSWLYAIPETSKSAANNYISALLSEGRYSEARRVFDKQLEDGPLEATYQMNYGLMLSMTGDPEEGIRYIEGALSAYPSVPYADVRRDGFVASTDAYFRERIGFGHFAVAESKLVMLDAEGALRAAEESLRYRPQFPFAVLIKSFALYALNRQAEADAEVARAMAMAHPKVQRQLERKRAGFMKKLPQFAERKEAESESKPTGVEQ